MFTPTIRELLFFLPLLTILTAVVPQKWKSAVLTVGGLAACFLNGWQTLLWALLSVFLGWFAVRCCPRTLTGPYAVKAKAWIAISFVLQTAIVILGKCNLYLLLSGMQAVICVIDRANGMLRIPSLPQYVGYICEYPRWFGFCPTDFAAYKETRENRKPFEIERCAIGLWKMVFGIFELVMISMTMFEFFSMIVESQIGTHLSLLDSWFAALAIYCAFYFGFHGRMDIGQGMHLVLGYELPDGYDAPIFSKSLREYCGRVCKPFRAAAGDITGIPEDSSKMSTVRWFFGVLACLLVIGMVFNESLISGIVWGVLAAAVLLAERMIPQKITEKIPAAVKCVLVTLTAVGFCYGLGTIPVYTHLSDILCLFGRGGIVLSGAALYAISWHWSDLLLAIACLFPLRKAYQALEEKYPIIEKISVAVVPLSAFGMILLCLMRLVAVYIS